VFPSSKLNTVPKIEGNQTPHTSNPPSPLTTPLPHFTSKQKKREIKEK
jgi:hypothetical protein